MDIKDKIKEFVKNNYQVSDSRNFLPGIDFVPVSGKVLDNLEIEYIIDSALDGWLTTGRFNKNFEVDWSEDTLTRGLFIHDSSNIFNSFTLIDTPGKNSDGEPLKHAVIFK